MIQSPTGADISLNQWLEHRHRLTRKGPASTLVLGGTGHLLLSHAEEAEAAAHLSGRVLPDIARQRGAGQVLLVTGAAPGADRVFNETGLDWFRQAGIPCLSVALLPVPPPWLHRDWLLRAEAAGLAPTIEARERCQTAIDRLLTRAHRRVPLYDTDDPDLEQKAASIQWRTDQYRALAACLAEQSDVLVAVLRNQRLGEPGGTAEVVEWRRHPQRIPPRFLAPQARTMRRSAHRSLIVIDPRVSFCGAPSPGSDGDGDDEATQILAQAEAARRDGNDLHCHDLLASAAKRGLRSRRMDYLRILALANVGSTRPAMEQYRSLVLAPDELSEDWLALLGRLEKNLALACDGDATPLLRQSALTYADAFERWRGPYSGVNSATMWRLAGNRDASRAMALAVRERLPQLQPQGEVDHYFHHATAAEVALLLDDAPGAEQQLRLADAYCANDVVRRGRTLQQLRLLCQKADVDPAVLGALRMPPLLLLRGSRAPAATAPRDIAVDADIPTGALAFMPLLDEGDLLLAEHLLARGAHLYPTLGQSLSEVRSNWLQRFGETVAQRLSGVLARCQRVAVVPGFLDSEADWCADQVASTTLGAAQLTARRLGCERRTAQIDREGSTLWVRAAANDTTADRVAAPGNRRMVGILFADFAGFGRIPDPDMPRFWREVMGTMSTRLSHYGARVLFSATWGDALHVITVDATTAAEIAADILQSLDERRLSRDGVLASLELRVGLHYAPAFEDIDPLRKTRVFYGSQLSFTARIEPVTPPGTVFGSDALVARLMLEAPERFSAEYAGELELAKKYGIHPLFAVHRRAPS